MGVEISHASLVGDAADASVPALVDSGSANSVVNWPAAALLFGLRPDDRIVREAPRIRAIGAPVLPLSEALFCALRSGAQRSTCRCSASLWL